MHGLEDRTGVSIWLLPELVECRFTREKIHLFPVKHAVLSFALNELAAIDVRDRILTREHRGESVRCSQETLLFGGS